MGAAAEVLTHLTAAGIRLEVREGALLATPRAALTDDTRALIRDHKAALVSLLAATNEPPGAEIPEAPSQPSPEPPAGAASRPAGAEGAVVPEADWHGFTRADLQAAAGADWPEVGDRPPVLADLLHTQAQRDHGEVPAHYTQPALCATCGPVWLWEGAPTHLIACPWCLTRPQGAPIPRPPEVSVEAFTSEIETEPDLGPGPAPVADPLVARPCAACAHYRPNPIGDGGLGVCKVSAPASFKAGSLWPGSVPRCSHWTAKPVADAHALAADLVQCRSDLDRTRSDLAHCRNDVTQAERLRAAAEQEREQLVSALDLEVAQRVQTHAMLADTRAELEDMTARWVRVIDKLWETQAALDYKDRKIQEQDEVIESLVLGGVRRERARAAARAIPPDLLPTLIGLSHPDRHGNSPAANRATDWLLKQREVAP